MTADRSLWPAPESWSWYQASEIGEVGLGRQRSPDNHSGPHMRPYIRSANITWNGLDFSDVKEMNFDEADFATFSLSPGDVLLNEGSGSADEVGKAVVWQGQIENCCFQNTVLRFRSDHVDPWYARAFFTHSAKTGRLVEHTQGINIFHIGKRGLEQFELPVPPLPEQHRIVKKLDALTARLARARSELDRAPALASQLRRQTLSDAFEETSKLGTEPVSFFLMTLDQGWSPKCENYPSRNMDEWAVLKTTAVQPLRYLAGENKALPGDLKPRPHLEVAAGDILVTRAGPRVRVGITCAVDATRPKLILADKIYRLRADVAKAVPYFIALMLNAPQSLDRIEGMKTGISDSGLNLTQEKFLSLPIPRLAVPQQQAWVENIQAIFARADRLEAEAARARALLDRLEAAILARAFRGELVPQDPNDEPASVLLERIRAQRAAAPQPKRGRRAAPVPPSA